MAKYTIESTIGAIANGIKKVIKSGAIEEDSSVIIYGLDRYSFAIRTILSNLGFHNVDSFISEDKALVAEHIRKVNDFASHYLNEDSGLIRVEMLKDRLLPFDKDVRILIACEDYDFVSKTLEGLGYRKDISYFVLYDFCTKEINDAISGKRKLSLGEVKNLEKDILKFIDARCKHLNIRYWVCGGTLLGTMRHKGFIPWDDDIDIFMPWEDYCRFLSSFEENEDYEVVGFATNDINDFPDPFAKVVSKKYIIVEDIGTVKKMNGVWVDVFPLIGMPSDLQERKGFFANYQELNRQIWQDFYKNNGSLEVFNNWYNKQLKFMNEYDFDTSEYVGVLGTAYKDRDSTKRSVYNDTLRLPFEDITVNVPVGYKEYLDNLYGTDWGELPPIDKRRVHHNIDAYSLCD